MKTINFNYFLKKKKILKNKKNKITKKKHKKK